MTLSAGLENILPVIRQAQALVGTRAVNDPSKFVRRFSNLRLMVSCDGGLNCGCGGNKETNSSIKLLGNGKQDLRLQQVRSICGRENCADPCDWPPCSPENIAKTECFQKNKERKEQKKKRSVYEVYWNKPECCQQTCLMEFPRFDDLYYQESDKENRIYTQTWIECPDIVIAPRPICCTQKFDYPPLCKRPRKERPKTACEMEKCPPDVIGQCPKVRMPCCRAARTAPCSKIKIPANCTKFNAPQPSFSECRKPDPKLRRPSECWCLAAPSMCRVWSEWRRLQLIKREKAEC